MECNKDEAAKTKELAEKKFEEKDIMGARKLAMKAQSLFPTLDGLQSLLATLNIYISAETKLNGEIDWYAVLGIDPSSDDETVKKQYRKLALTLHPDKNKSVGAEGAFKILSEAWSVLSDKARRVAYDQKRNSREIYQKVMPSNPSKSVAKNGLRPSANNGNFNIRSMNSPNPHSVPVNPPRRNTFWTVCTSCKMQFEYVLFYLNKNLQCYSCKEPFVATQIPPPQTNLHPQWSSHIPQQTSSYPATAYNSSTEGGMSVQASASSAAQMNGTEPQVSATLEDVMKSRTNAFKRANVGEKPKKRRRANEQKIIFFEKTDQLAGGGETAGFGSSNGGQRTFYETEKVSIGTKWQATTRELSLLETRNMLMSKAKMEICKKLDEWRNKEACPKEKGKRKDLHNGVVNGMEHPGSKPDVCVIDKNPDEELNTSTSATSSVDHETPASHSASLSMTVPDPDFHDFDQDRTENSFGDNQVWAAYDNDDGMPRFYAMIHNVASRKPFKMRISWLNSKSTAEFGPMNWVSCGFYKTSGDFRVGKYEINKSVNSFSQRVKWRKGARGAIRIYPSKGDTWALYKNWSREWNEHTPDNVIHQYDMVEVLDEYNEEKGITVIPLVKVPGFKTVFRQHMDRKQARVIPREEMFRFSHQVPSCLLTGQESPNAPKGCWELDPAATPLELLQVITEAPEKAAADEGFDPKKAY